MPLCINVPFSVPLSYCVKQNGLYIIVYPRSDITDCSPRYHLMLIICARLWILFLHNAYKQYQIHVVCDCLHMCTSLPVICVYLHLLCTRHSHNRPMNISFCNSLSLSICVFTCVNQLFSAIYVLLQLIMHRYFLKSLKLIRGGHQFVCLLYVNWLDHRARGSNFTSIDYYCMTAYSIRCFCDSLL